MTAAIAVSEDCVSVTLKDYDDDVYLGEEDVNDFAATAKDSKDISVIEEDVYRILQ